MEAYRHRLLRPARDGLIVFSVSARQPPIRQYSTVSRMILRLFRVGFFHHRDCSHTRTYTATPHQRPRKKANRETGSGGCRVGTKVLKASAAHKWHIRFVILPDMWFKLSAMVYFNLPLRMMLADELKKKKELTEL